MSHATNASDTAQYDRRERCDHDSDAAAARAPRPGAERGSSDDITLESYDPHGSTDRNTLSASLRRDVDEKARSNSGDHRPLGQEIAAALPDDALDARVAAVAFLRQMGRSPAPVVVGEYELQRSLGGGGFGRVYLAIQPGLGRQVALKLLREHRVAQGVEWLRREAHALAQLNHPNVVQVYQVGESVDGTFIAMEYVDGDPLKTWQVDRPWAEVLDAYRQAALGLAAAHDRGILHLDFKPSNVLVGSDGRVRVVDFGLAAGAGVSSSSAQERHVVPNAATVSGPMTSRAAGGTEGYASPEQAAGGHVDARSDQFSFCAALYEAMHGVLPHTPMEIAVMAANRRVFPPANGVRRCPRWVERVLRRGLRANRSERWPSMRALLAALDPPRWHRRAPGLVLIGAFVGSLPAAIYGAAEPTTSSCADVASTVIPTWNAERRATLDATMAAHGAPWSEHLRTTLLDALERHVARTAETAFEVCAIAQAVGEPRPAAHTCLARQRDRFEDVVALLERDDETIGAHADRLLAELGDPASCAAPNAATIGGPRQRDSAEADALREVDQVRLDIAAGRFMDAVSGAEQAVARAQDLGHLAIAAETRLVRGLARDAIGRDEEALDDLDESGVLAMSIGRDDLAAESWRRAAWIAGDDIGDLDRAERWVRLARAAIVRLGSPPLAFAELLDTEGLLRRLHRDAPAAEASHRAALLQLGAALPPDDPRWGATWLLLANAVAEQGRSSEAKALYERALTLARTQLGEQHPRIAMILVARALVARDLAVAGDPAWLDGASDDLDAAARILLVPQGSDPALLASTRTLHAEIELMRGDLDGAAVLAEEAWALQQRHLPARHEERGSALTVIARVELARHDWERALDVHLELERERAEIDDDIALAAIDNNIGWLLCRVGRCAEARRYHDRAFERGDAMQRAYAESGRGRVVLVAGRSDEARTRLEHAMSLVAALGDGAPADLRAETQWYLADARIRLGDGSEHVRALVEQALRFYRESGTDEHAVAELTRLRSALSR